jgi:hypothetical protein
VEKIDILSRITDEVAGLWQDFSYLCTFLSVADKLAGFFAISMLVGVFMPWVSADGFFTETGLMGGGDLHLLLAILTFFQIKKVATCQIKAMRKKGAIPLISLRLRRIALTYLLIGLTSTIAAIVILLYFGSQHTKINGIDIRLGFYLTLSSGIGIFGCGFERFTH